MAGYVGLERTATAGTAHADSTVSAGGSSAGASDGVRRRLLQIAVHYSGSPTQTGVTATINSGAGANYDSKIATGTANVQNTVFTRATFGDIILMGDDSIDVLAPDGGVGITAYTTILCEGYYGANA